MTDIHIHTLNASPEALAEAVAKALTTVQPNHSPPSPAYFEVKNERDALQAKIAKAGELALEGIETDGDHHKQWYLAEIARALDIPLTRAYHEDDLGCPP